MKSYAKINVFLKIIGTRGGYHEILSRFILVDEIYDEIEFVNCEKFARENKSEICIQSDKKIPGENIIKKCAFELKKLGFGAKIDDFFASHKIKITKNIPMGGGLGGGSSNAATFLREINRELNLEISRENLMQIGAKIGADVPFFLSEFKSANVSGIGEIIEPFNDEMPNFRLNFKPFCADTAQIYSCFRANFMSTIDAYLARNLSAKKSNEILANFKNYELNDLAKPFENITGAKLRDDEFLSGSGSTTFCLKSLNLGTKERI